MFSTLRQWLQAASQDKRVLLLLGLAAVGAVAIILGSGRFGVQLSQYFAGRSCNIYENGDDFCQQDCERQGKEGGSCQEYGGESGRGQCECYGESSSGTSADEPCVPVDATSWTGGADACVLYVPPSITPPPVPDNFIPHLDLTNPGGLPGLATSAPYGSADGYTCFGFTLPDGNAWAAVDARKGGTVPVPRTTHTLTGTFFNNCPWEVEMTGGAAVSPKAGSGFIFNENGSVDEPWFGADNLLTRGTTQRIPSCWNYPHIGGSTSGPAPAPAGGGGGGGAGGGGGTQQIFEPSLIRPVALFRSLFGSHAYAQAVSGPQAGCTGEYTISFNVQFNAGRAEVSLGWKHFDGIGSAEGNATIMDGYNIVMNTGRDCTGAPGEFCSTAASNSGGGGGGGGGGTGTTGTTGPGPGGSFNCGTGSGSDACWCGEWTDAIWAQRHYVAAVTCDPGFIIDETHGAPPGAIGKGAAEFGDWSRTVVQAFIDIMDENYDGGNEGCTPRASGVDYAGIQEAYFAIYNYGGWGLSSNGTSAVAKQCQNPTDVAAVLTASCPTGRPPVLLSWNLPVGNVANGIIKRNLTTGEDGSFINDITRRQTSYEDDSVEPGNRYSYTHKASAVTASEPAIVRIEQNGTCVVESGGTSPTPTPTGVNVTITPTPTATQPVVFVTITPPPDGQCRFDSDGDGICDDRECPTRSDGRCVDSDRDGRPDWNDADSYIGSAGGVATGPGEVTVLALLVSVLTALMYMSYTHTDIFRRHEAEQLGERQGPMDFRQ